MLRLPPISPLFPYTTLFRSLLHFHFFSVAQLFMGVNLLFQHAEVVAHHDDLVKEDLHRHLLGLEGDRKSTRLNSSHLVISYAVFCLKKKTNTREPSIILSLT